MEQKIEQQNEELKLPSRVGTEYEQQFRSLQDTRDLRNIGYIKELIAMHPGLVLEDDVILDSLKALDRMGK